MKSIYNRLLTLVNNPEFTKESDNPLFLQYNELLMELTPRQKYYWKNKEQLTLHYRQKYADKKGSKPRTYQKTDKEVTVKRSDFPSGSEGDRQYKKAYQKEWWAINHPPKTQDPSYCRQYNKSEVWNNRQAARTAAAKKSTVVKQKTKDIMRLYYDLSNRSLWTVEGGVSGEYHRIENRNDTLDNTLLYLPRYTLSSFYEALKAAAGYADEGELRTLALSNKWSLSKDIQKELERLFFEVFSIVSDSCVLIDMYKAGEPLGEGVRDEIQEMRNNRNRVRLELSVLLRKIKTSVRKNISGAIDKGQVTEDQQQDLLQPLFFVFCLRSGIISANYNERKEMYLYYKLHKFSMYKKDQKKEVGQAERNRKEQFDRLDKQLTEKGMTSQEYWTRSNEHGITAVDVEGQETSVSIEELKEQRLTRQNKLTKEQKLDRELHQEKVEW